MIARLYDLFRAFFRLSLWPFTHQIIQFIFHWLLLYEYFKSAWACALHTLAQAIASIVRANNDSFCMDKKKRKKIEEINNKSYTQTNSIARMRHTSFWLKFALWSLIWQQTKEEEEVTRKKKQNNVQEPRGKTFCMQHNNKSFCPTHR